MTVMLDAALEYALAGWPVLPVRGRKPTVKHGVYDATTDMDMIRSWLDRKNPGSGIAIACGGQQRLLVIDVDPRNGGMETLADLRKEHGAFPRGPVARSGGGGWHLYLRGETAKTSLGDGVDVKRAGGYVVAPPSMHPCGHSYQWVTGRGLIDCEIAEAPQWIVDDPRTERTATFAPAPEGERNTRLARLAWRMMTRGFDVDETTDLLLGWASTCKPPYPADETRKTVRSVARSIARKLTAGAGR